MDSKQIKKLDEIHSALVGSEFNQGIVKDVEDLKKSEKINSRFRWTFATAILMIKSYLITKIM